MDDRKDKKEQESRMDDYETHKELDTEAFDVINRLYKGTFEDLVER